MFKDIIKFIRAIFRAGTKAANGVENLASAFEETTAAVESQAKTFRRNVEIRGQVKTAKEARKLANRIAKHNLSPEILEKSSKAMQQVADLKTADSFAALQTVLNSSGNTGGSAGSAGTAGSSAGSNAGGDEEQT